MHANTTPAFHPVACADHRTIDDAVTQWPERWRDEFEERWRIIADDHPAPRPVWALRSAYKYTISAAAWEGVVLADGVAQEHERRKSHA